MNSAPSPGSAHTAAKRQSLEDKLATDAERGSAARDTNDLLAARVEALRREQDEFEQFQMNESWRHAELPRLRDEPDQHWAARAGGRPPRLWDRQAPPRPYRRGADLQNLDAGTPADRSKDFNEARGQLPNVIRAKHDAEQSVADGHSRLEEAGQRR